MLDGYIPLCSRVIGDFYIAFEPHSHSLNIYMHRPEPAIQVSTDSSKIVSDDQSTVPPASMLLIGYLKVTYSQAAKPTESEDDPSEKGCGLDAVYISDFQIYFNYQDLKLAVPVITLLRDTLSAEGYRLLAAHIFKNERSYAKLHHTYIERCGATIRREYSDYVIIEWQWNPADDADRRIR